MKEQIGNFSREIQTMTRKEPNGNSKTEKYYV